MKPYKFTVSALVFVACSVLTTCLLACLVHKVTQAVALSSFILGVVAAVAAWKTCGCDSSKRPLRCLDWLVIAFFAAVSCRAFLWLVFTDEDQLKVLSPNNLGDLIKHWDYMNFMAQSCYFWPDNPLLAGSTIRYPIGMDLFNSMLVVCGADLLRSLLWVGLGGCLLTGVALFRWGRAFTLAGFLFNGGVAGFLIFTHFEFRDFQAELAWKNFFLSILVTQRGFLFCLPAGLVLLDSWRSRLEGRDNSLPLWIELVLYASMPLFHIHTFLFLSFLLGCWFLAAFTTVVMGKKFPNSVRDHWIYPVSKTILPHVLKLVSLAFVPATLLVLLVTEFFKAPSFFRFQAGWMQGSTPFFNFWIGDFGALIPLTLALCVWLFVKKDLSASRFFVLPAVAVFVLCCFFVFAPWEWDNTKLMLWSYVTILPFLWNTLLRRWPAAIRAAFCVLLFFSGFVSLIGGLKGGGYAIGTRSELDALSQVLRGIPISARIAAAPDFDHPLLLLGRKVGMSYSGYLFGHGLPYEKQERDLNILMRGEPGWEQAAKELEVGYVFWGGHESTTYPNSTKPWLATASVVASGPWGTLYKLMR